VTIQHILFNQTQQKATVEKLRIQSYKILLGKSLGKMLEEQEGDGRMSYYGLFNDAVSNLDHKKHQMAG
jgi:hypothetical protein